MTKKIILCLLALLFPFALPAAAETLTVSCGGALASVEFTREEDDSLRDLGVASVVMTVSKDKFDVRLRFLQGHFGIECRRSPQGQELFVFQFYCSGSACHDFDNFGIVDPKDLRVLLVPEDDNSSVAERIFGGPVEPVKTF